MELKDFIGKFAEQFYETDASEFSFLFNKDVGLIELVEQAA